MTEINLLTDSDVKCKVQLTGVDNVAFDGQKETLENVSSGIKKEETRRHLTPASEEMAQDHSEDLNLFYCGLSWCRPQWMQKCKTMECFTVSFSLTGIVTSALNIYMNSQITTLERQFNFSSSLSGLLMSCNDFGYLLTILFLSYYARQVHVPRALALSTLLYGVSGLLCTVPFFGTRASLPSPPTEQANTSTSHVAVPLCTNTTTQERNCLSTNKTIFDVSESWRTVAILTLGLGMALQGVAKSPRQPFLGTYVDDNVAKTKTSMYLGIMVGLSISGPAIAFTLGGLFSRLYITLEETTLSPRDPRWLGAWWLGFLVFGLCGLVVGIPLVFFPRRLVDKQERQEVKSPTSKRLVHDLKGLAAALLRLGLNPVYMCLLVSNGLNIMVASGTMAFMPKYLETQFNIPTWQANLYLGSMNIVAAFIGTILGGCLTTRFKLSPLNCLKWVLLSKCLGTLLGVTGFVTGCKQPVFQSHTSSNGNICSCDNQRYFPVCGTDGSNYFSPCHAGCHSVNTNNTYSHCENMPSNTTQGAMANLCQSTCQNLFIFLALMFIAAFVTTLALMPTFIASVRSVQDREKPIAIGLSAFSSTLLGWLPGPIIFGALIDTSCIVWNKSCLSTGACLLYDIEKFRLRIHALILGLRLISIVLSSTALVVAVYFKRFAFQEHREIVITLTSKTELTEGNVQTNLDREMTSKTELTEGNIETNLHREMTSKTELTEGNI
ncbi:solute carrier organic anion transporter family member 2A1-like isoform X3 [Biomphalaria glabrata]|nr:solute carrier organic anion transporter family member 2A1-like isoform X3 [Biomphalaria glabrata]XP_055871892.1 solute carrier organic anion transporter family member 2A1-like isoform X3 [Biomphalaria glabrata]XP_055871893.1 solute carrier organic anion transporter family member 2A1-like isoform X3 [Biomphalaria glabrata]XP_055871894.1 solute carrier organic anion transporter family member 2A1-like isoform X3 [Biomphalaria glabrata]